MISLAHELFMSEHYPVTLIILSLNETINEYMMSNTILARSIMME